MSEEKESCLNCHYWIDKEIQLQQETQTLYFCRRYPPVAGVGYPETAEDDWCGEWKEWKSPAETRLDE